MRRGNEGESYVPVPKRVNEPIGDNAFIRERVMGRIKDSYTKPNKKIEETIMEARWCVDNETGERFLLDLVSGEVICSEKEWLAMGKGE